MHYSLNDIEVEAVLGAEASAKFAHLLARMIAQYDVREERGRLNCAIKTKLNYAMAIF